MLTYEEALSQSLAAEGRRVVSPWRTVVLLERWRRMAPSETRRWRKPPRTVREAERLLKRLVRAGALTPVGGCGHLYQLRVPFADRLGPIDDRELLMELHPYAALSHFTAMVSHGLTEQTPRAVHLSEPYPLTTLNAPPPPGIEPVEFETLALVPLQRPKRLRQIALQWHRLKPVRWFGVELTRPLGSWQARCTDLDRTLLDGVTAPRFCGGMRTVIEAWAAAIDQIDVVRLVDYTERLGVDVVRRRVGFLLERMGLFDPRMAAWTTTARGGSLKLDPAAAFTKTAYSERWSLSVNCSLAALDEVGGGE